MDLAPLHAKLDRIEAKVDLLRKPEEPVIGRTEIMRLLGVRSQSALDRAKLALGIKPFLRGKYRRQEVANAILRRRLEDELAEKKTEGRLGSRPTPQE